MDGIQDSFSFPSALRVLDVAFTFVRLDTGMEWAWVGLGWA